jgi:hypothetical protein
MLESIDPENLGIYRIFKVFLIICRLKFLSRDRSQNFLQKFPKNVLRMIVLRMIREVSILTDEISPQIIRNIMDLMDLTTRKIRTQGLRVFRAIFYFLKSPRREIKKAAPWLVAPEGNRR